MTQIILDKAILQEVWEDMRKPRIYEDQPNTLYYDSRYGWDCEIEVVHLPSGQYEILGLGSEIMEAHFVKVVEMVIIRTEVPARVSGFIDWHGYKNYESDNQFNDAFDTAIASFASLLRSHNLQPETTLVILKK